MVVSVTYGHDGNNVKQYDNAMDYSIARKAIDDQIGYEVIKLSIVNNGILEDERIKTLLTVKANSTLTSMDLEEITDQGDFIFNRGRYGLVTVYPYQVDDNSILNSPPKGVGKKMTLTELEKEIITAIRESRKINGLFPNPVKLIKKLFKEY